jgi:hypothetical protein
MRNGFFVIVGCSFLGGCLDEPVQSGAASVSTGVIQPSQPANTGGNPAAPAQSGAAAATLAANSAPEISGVPSTLVVAGVSYRFQPQVRDADGDVLAHAITGLPAWARFDALRGEISGTPGDADAGESADIVLSVSDGYVSASLPAFRIVIQPRSAPPAPPAAAPAPRNVAPTIGGKPPLTVAAGTSYSFTPQASDADSGVLTFTIVNRPAWAAFSTATGILSGTPAAGQSGSYRDIMITVSDGVLATSLPSFSVDVTPPPNRPPTISGLPPASVPVGTAYSFRPAARDSDADTIRFTLRNAPAWLSLDPSTGEISGTPGASDIGSRAAILLTVSDGRLSVDLPAFSLTVVAAPDAPPTLGGTPSTAVTAGSAYNFQPSGFDPEGQPLVYSIANRPSWAVFSTTTGALTGTPTAGNIGSHAGIVISVSDGRQSTALPAFAISVTAVPNALPRIAGTPGLSVEAATAYRFAPTASDPDGQPLTFSIQNAPAWATFSPATGTLAGTPTRAQVDTYRNIVISVSDGSASVALPAFSIVVESPPNQAPRISGSPDATVIAGTGYSFVPTATDTDVQALGFSIQNRPAWASFNPASGALTGTPTRAQVGVYGGITITVTDGIDTAVLPAFAITVSAPPNQAPQISGVPTTTLGAGQSFSFVPTASDPDPQTLTFSVVNRPAWALFNASTGALTGSPATTDAGTYADILIRVSDGTATTALPAFTLVVTAPAPPPVSPPPSPSGTANVVWTAPTLDEDGSPVQNIAGYRVYAGSSASTLSLLTTVNGAGVTSATFDRLAGGTHCYAVSALTASGLESARSAVGCKTVP